MNTQLREKLQLLPKESGVYFHKDAKGHIIYVGKAAVLRNRVKQYFHKSRQIDPKTDALVKEIADVDWIITSDEIEALFLEAEMIRRYQPQYNILLRDDKSVSYIRIDAKAHAPTVSITRRPLDDGAEYFGPFLQALPLRRSLKYLRKVFPYSTHVTLPNRACLQHQIGLCPGPETEQYNEKEYKENLKKLILYINGRRSQLLQQLESEMKQAAAEKQFEIAAKKRNALLALKSLRARIIFSDKENLDLSSDHALSDITQLFRLPSPPQRIEGYDISHMSGTDTVASMVVFTNGIADKGAYRKFKMRLPGNDDFAHMNEVMNRRLSKGNTKKWRLPDLFLIDGGKGQLGAAITARNAANISRPMIGLAKKYEEIIINKEQSNVQIDKDMLQKLNGTIHQTDEYVVINLPNSSHIIKLLQRIRDESHRFAVSYHSTLKVHRQTNSQLDTIPGIGPMTKKALLRSFGSLRSVESAKESEIAKIIGAKKAKILFANLHNQVTNK